MSGHILSFFLAELAFALAFALASFAAFAVDGVKGVSMGGICLGNGCKTLSVFTPLGVIFLCTLRCPMLIWILPFWCPLVVPKDIFGMIMHLRETTEFHG